MRQTRLFAIQWTSWKRGAAIGICGVLGILLGPDVTRLHAQTTAITSSGLNTAIQLSGTTTFIDGGTRPETGPNLFHSFGDFSIGEGHTALFRGSGDTTNIFGRVTGGNVSNIFGTIDSATNFPQANLWLINPAGFLFGPTASINVGGSVNISTADYLKMTDGTRFNALPGPADALLSMAPVEAFGFLERPTLDPTFGRITINGSKFGATEGTETDTDFLPPLTGLSLVGRDITFTGAKLNQSRNNFSEDTVSSSLLLASVVSGGEVRLVPVAGAIGVSSHISAGTILGRITLDDTTIRNASLMRFFGDTLTMRNSVLESTADGDSIDGNSIEVNLTGRLSIADASFIKTQVSSAEVAGDIIIRAPIIELKGGSIKSFANFDGNAGTINIFGKRLTVSDGEISTIVLDDEGGSGGKFAIHLTEGMFLARGGHIRAKGFGGDLSIQAPVVEITGGSIGVETGGSSRAIKIAGETVRIRNGQISTATSSDSKSPVGPGNIELDLSGDLLLESSGRISTSLTVGFGTSEDQLSGGDIQIRAGSVHLQGGTIDSTSALLEEEGFIPLIQGRAGNITIQAVDGIQLTAGSTITSEVTGPGQAGNIALNAGQDLRIENGRITSASLRHPTLVTNGLVGTAGEILLTAGHDIQSRESRIATTSADGSGGNIKLTAPNVIRLVDSTLTSSVQGQVGSNGGNIFIDPIAVAIQNSQILANANAGAGGIINVVASGAVLVDPNSQLSASAGPAGVSGSVNINAPIQVLGGTLVPLKVAYSQAVLSADRCAADPQGQFSSFVQTGRDGVPQIPGGYAPSPLLPLNRLVSISRGAQGPRLAAARLGLGGIGVEVSTQFQLQSGCRS